MHVHHVYLRIKYEWNPIRLLETPCIVSDGSHIPWSCLLS
jgi:hypothetical protein